MDYAVWSEINKRMRKQERNFDNSKRETRAQYLTRFKRTAKRLPGTFINETVDDMRRRCQRLYDAHGGSFEEGGMSGCHHAVCVQVTCRSSTEELVPTRGTRQFKRGHV